MITVFIENLRFKTIIGILDVERVQKQNISVDAEFRTCEFIDYSMICEIIKTKFDDMKFMKIEDALTFFESEFKILFSTLNYFYMKITKIDIVPNAFVGVKIEKFY